MEAVNGAIQRIINTFNEDAHQIFKSTTADNGSEFASLSESVKYTTDIYFAYPYSSFERGTNEKQNALLRRFFPKGKSFANTPAEVITAAQERINNLPRKIFNYSCSNELFSAFVNDL